jgi:hypothetical protein
MGEPARQDDAVYPPARTAAMAPMSLAIW